jgi:hypothetical protein
MKTVKTAISIDTRTFERVEQLSRKLHISRSQFFTQAARHMVERDESLDLLRRINAAYAPGGDDAVRLRHQKAYTRAKTAEPW